MSEFPSLPLFTDAFLADTGHLTAQETGAYLLLLMMAWRQPGCCVPDNDQKLARWARVDARTWARIKPAVMEFWTLENGSWTQKRLAKERGIVSKRAEVARENGQRGGRPKSLENNDPANPTGYARVSQTKAPNPNPSKEEIEDKPLSQAGERKQLLKLEAQRSFPAWYDLYPKHVDPKDAERVFVRLVVSGSVTLEELFRGVRAFATQVAAAGTEKQFIKAPAVWLNKGCWANEIIPPPQGRPPPAIRKGAATLFAEATESHRDADFHATDLYPAEPLRPENRRSGGPVLEQGRDGSWFDARDDLRQARAFGR